MKKLIGLTGKTGSGKTSASKFFKDLGAFVIDCDSIAHNALFDEKIIEELKKTFPTHIFENGKVNRKALGEIVFSNKDELKKLNSIVHPWICHAILTLAESAPAGIVIIDGSELEASGIDKKCEHIIVIEADEAIRLERIMARDNISIEAALLRINAQIPYSKKAIIINNDSGESNLRKEVERLYKIFSE